MLLTACRAIVKDIIDISERTAYCVRCSKVPDPPPGCCEQLSEKALGQE